MSERYRCPEQSLEAMMAGVLTLVIELASQSPTHAGNMSAAAMAALHSRKYRFHIADCHLLQQLVKLQLSQQFSQINRLKQIGIAEFVEA